MILDRISQCNVNNNVPLGRLFRPGFMRPTRGLKHTHWFYRVLDPLFPLANLLFPRALLTLSEVGLAMIHAAGKGPEKRVLEVSDIATLAMKGPAKGI